MTTTTHPAVLQDVDPDLELCVIVTTTIGDTSTSSIKWAGTDAKTLSYEHPPSDIMFADPLGHSEIEGGHIRSDYDFYERQADGSWQEISDPRVRLTPITEYERAIDAENRRDFPGDYIDECGYCGSDPCVCEDDEDRYRVDCATCDDHGCALSDPNWCADCDNHGCATCMPDYVCKGCGMCVDPHHESLDKDSGLCQECMIPICFDNCSEFADGEDGLCSGCREHYVQLDASIQEQLLREEEDMERQALEYELEYEIWYATWPLRLLWDAVSAWNQVRAAWRKSKISRHFAR